MNWTPRYVTLISGESPCRGLDGLADGFMRWLGKERVRLHLLLGPSAEIQEFQYFHSVYEWAKHGTWEWPIKETELLVISTRQIEQVSDWIAEQHFSCPIATLDPRDKPCDEIQELTAGSYVQVSFKLELPYTADPNTRAFPCPHGLVPEELPPLKPYAERSIPVLFMGGVSNATRPVLAEALQKIPGAKVALSPLPRKEYLQLLTDTQIGVACYGAGFGSYRYWEIPYCGALLVAQPLPIVVPRNFQREKQALFYMTPSELLETVQWALSHPTEAAEIAKAGTLHLLQHHLSLHRAQWVADVVWNHCAKYVAEQQLARRWIDFPW